MSMYTTGEIAKLCNVSVRTVQYYDTRNLLVPSELSEGGRRLYSEQDVKKMKTICFLRDAGISIQNIGELLKEENPGNVISLLLDRQEKQLKEELEERKTKLDTIDTIRKEIKSIDHFSVESIGDIAYQMENKAKLKRLRIGVLVLGLPLEFMQWATLFLGIWKGIWWPMILWAVLFIPFGIFLSLCYMKKLAYICPQCHEVFQAKSKEAIFAKHTLRLRKLTCTCCGYHGFCVETYRKEK